MLGFNKFCTKLCFDKFSRLFCASYILRSSLFRIFLGNHFIKRNLHRKATGCHWRMMKLTRLGIVQGWCMHICPLPRDSFWRDGHWLCIQCSLFSSSAYIFRVRKYFGLQIQKKNLSFKSHLCSQEIGSSLISTDTSYSCYKFPFTTSQK